MRPSSASCKSTAEAGIEARGIGKPQIITIGQQPLRIEAYFVQHAGKENDAGRFNVVAAGRLSIHVEYYFWSFHPPDGALSFQSANRECKQPGVEKKSNY